jgi:hypothetical protein
LSNHFGSSSSAILDSINPFCGGGNGEENRDLCGVGRVV